MNIESLREQIDAVDCELLLLLNIRAKIVLELATIKRDMNIPLYDALRERRIIERTCRLNRGPLDDSALRSIFNVIIGESRRIVSKIV